jgi:hypothetical protein
LRSQGESEPGDAQQDDTGKLSEIETDRKRGNDDRHSDQRRV